MNRLLIFVAALLLTACVKVTDEKPTEEAQPAPDQAPSTVTAPKSDQPEPIPDSRPAYLVSPLSEPLHYEVRLLMPESSVVVERVLLSDQSRVVLPLNFNDGYLVDPTALSNQKYLYRFGRLEKGQFNLQKEIPIQIPKDLVIQNEVNLLMDESWSDSSRIFLLTGGIITTNGFQLLVKTQKLYAFGGVVRTFASADGPAPGGRKNGGVIEFEADEATGVFRIQLLGKNGSAGTTVAGNFVGTDGENGGNTGMATLNVKTFVQMGYEPLLTPGKGGAGGMGSINFGVFPAVGVPGNTGANGRIESFCVKQVGGRSCW